MKVRLFAAAKQIVGAEEIVVELEDETVVRDLRKEVESKHPELRDILACSRIAINASYASEDSTVSQDDEIAIIPPVSGG